MAGKFGYGFSGVTSHPSWTSSPFAHPSAQTPPFHETNPVESYDQTQGGFGPIAYHGFYPLSPIDWSMKPSSSLYPDSSQPGNFGFRGEDSCEDIVSKVGYYPSRETSSDVVSGPPVEPYNSATTVSSLADMLIRNSQEPFYKPIPPAGVCASVNAFDLNPPGFDFPGFYDPGYVKDESMDAAVSAPPVEPYGRLPPMPVLTLKTKDGSQTRTVDSTGSRSPRPLQFNAKPSSSLCKEKGEGSGVSSLYQRPGTLVADSEDSVSESSLEDEVDDLIYDEHRSWNNFSEGHSAPSVFSMGSGSCGAMKADKGSAAQSAVNSKHPSESSANQPGEDAQAIQKPCKLAEQLVDIMIRDERTKLWKDRIIKGSSRSNAVDVSTGQSPVCDQGGIPSPASSPRVSSVVDAIHNLSEVLVYECFNNRSWLKPEQLENLNKVVENLTKCLKKITSNKTIEGEASVPTQAMHVSRPNVVDLNEVPSVAEKDGQGFNVRPLDSFGFKESVDKDKNEMTQSIKNILASNFPDGEENHPQTLLYKNLWLETEAALCSTTCLARYHRVQNETDNVKLQNREISADASTFMQEPLNPQKSVSIMDNVEQETSESLIKDGSNCGNNVVTMSHDAPQTSRFNSGPVEAVLSLLEQDGNVKTGDQILNTAASTSGVKDNDVIDRFQILKHQETKRKLKSQNSSETRMDEQEDNQEASEMATIGRSSYMSDVMGRFEILERREAEEVHKSLNSVDSGSDSDSDSDSDNDQPGNKTQMFDYLLSGSMMTEGGNSKIETVASDTEPSANGEGYESSTSDWEYVNKDD